MATRIQAPAPRPRHTQMQKAQPTIKTTPPTVKDQPPDDDLVPSLPPDWKPPSFSTQEILSSADVSENEEEVKHSLDQEVILM